MFCCVQGHIKYKKDAMKASMPFYSRSHFYIRCSELKLKDSKSEAGLCANCTRYNIFARLKAVRRGTTALRLILLWFGVVWL